MASVALLADTAAPSRYNLSQLPDDEVLAGTRRMVGASNQLLADLLAHLAEVETRGIHRVKACSSLYTYCIYELRFSEDAAFRRSSAARFVKAFPALFDAVASGELHLTGLLMVGPHLTAANQQEVLGRAKHRTKKELAKLVRELDPLPDVPARIAPLGPEPTPRTHLRNPTWAEYVAAMAGPVRHLRPDERPREWVDESTIAAALATSSAVAEADGSASASNDTAPERDGEGASKNTAPERDAPSASKPQRYAVQFTASQEYVDLIERAKALLSHTGGASLEAVHLKALQCLVEKLEKKRYGARRDNASKRAEEPEQVQTRCDRDDFPRGCDAGTAAPTNAEISSEPEKEGATASRYIPARIRRRVFERDGARCTFVDDAGQRCREVERLELHHLEPFARDGRHQARRRQGD